MLQSSTKAFFRLSDGLTPESVRALAERLHLDFLAGSVSPRSYDHRSRVVRQQKALLAARSTASSRTESSVGSQEIVPPHFETVQVATTMAAVEDRRASRLRSIDRWENEGGPVSNTTG